MAKIATYRKAALSFEQVTETAHFEKVSFRIHQKIFCSLDTKNNRISIKLSEIDQSIYCKIDPTIIFPATGSWGKQGWTIFDLLKVKKSILLEVMKKGYLNIMTKLPIKIVKNHLRPEQIQTLHPDKTKINKKIALDKYNTIKKYIISILAENELTHTDLMENLYKNVKKSFVGSVQWYGETVKFDLEARKILERTPTKPEKYRLRPRTR